MSTTGEAEPMNAPTGGSSYRRRRQSLARGYLYQDLVAALALTRTLVDGDRAVRIETATSAGEVFDDHVVTLRDGRDREAQVKHSDAARALTEGDFTHADGQVRIDLLLQHASASPDAEFRLFATWAPPPRGASLLVPASATRLDTLLPTSLWRLDVDAIWPPGGPPRWSRLADTDRGGFVNLCGRFVLELEAPQMSEDLDVPGPLEQRLLDAVSDELEVRRPPNSRDPVDVAGCLVLAAMAARSASGAARRFTPADIVKKARLLVDTGRLAAAFPLEAERLVPTALLDQLLDASRTDGRVVVTGPPGAGKSWALEAVVPRLRAAGVVVARHYCFLEPGDPDAQERVGIEAMCSNLIAELRSDERLRESHMGLARDLTALGAALVKAAGLLASREAPGTEETAPLGDSPKDPPRLVVIVDGIDHVARVDPVAGPRAVSDLVLGLAALPLPPGVTLIFGSQPGQFLDPIADGARELHPPPFDRERVHAQLKRFDLPRLLRERGASNEYMQSLLDVFTTRSAGNPLYVRFLALELLGALKAGTDIPDVLRGNEGLPAGELNAYYARLLHTSDTLVAVVGEQLAVLDFTVTPAELAEILPAPGRARIDAALAQLRPILARTPGEGVRVYHESLRRYVIERVRASGSLADLAAAAVTWLDTKGFFQDERAFRWLLPMLRRAGRDAECIARIEPDFIARSVVEMHPGVAVVANIASATYAARNRHDFVALARLAELRRGAETTYEERMSDIEDYGRTVIALHGAAALAQRLLYDGRPVYPRTTGLRLCALIERAGTAAPWQEYVGLSDLENVVGGERKQEQIDQLHGELATMGAEAVPPAIGAWLDENPDGASWYRRGVAELTGELYGAPALQAILAITKAPAAATVPFRIALARKLSDDGDREAVLRFGREALEACSEAEPLLALLDLGVPASEIAARCPHPVTLVAAAAAERHTPDARAIEDFVTAVIAHGAAGEDLHPLRAMIVGDGWFRHWLRFVVDLGVVQQGRTSIVSAFERVAADTRPFVGTPRAVDLYNIRDLIDRTMRRGLDLATTEERREIVRHLLNVAYGTTTSLGNTPSGPLTLQALLQLLEAAPDRELVTFVDAAIARRSSDVYETHATDALTLARLWQALGDVPRARDYWRKARRFLAAYGYHKDVTIFGLMNGIEALAPAALDEARFRLLQMRHLTDLATEHTDGDETRHAPRQWFRLLAHIDPLLATRTLTRIIARTRIPSTGLDELVGVVLAKAPASLDPDVRHVLWRCLPARAFAEERLQVVADLLARDPTSGAAAFHSAAADIEGDAEKEPEAISALRAFTAAHGLRDPGLGLTAPEPETPSAESQLPPPGPARTKGPFFPNEATPTELLLAMRQLYMDRSKDRLSKTAVGHELAEHLKRIASTSGEAMVVLLMEETARVRPYSDGREFFETLGDDLRATHPMVAAEAYVHAWCAARPDWDIFGGPKHIALIQRAVALDESRALDRLATEIAAVLVRGYALGLSQRIVEVLVALGRIPHAIAAWDAAFAAVDYRLPELGDERHRFRVPDDLCVDHSTIFGELLGALLTHPVFVRRAAAMAACVELAPSAPDLVRAAMSFALGAHSTFTDRLIALQLTLDTGILPSAGDKLRELAQSEPMSVALLARRVLTQMGEQTPDRSGYIWIPPTVTSAQISEALLSDYADRAERLGAIYWSDFPEAVADAFWRLRNGEGDPEGIRQAQAEEQTSRSARWVPVLHLHDWYRELFEVALNQSLWALRAYLSRTGGVFDPALAERWVRMVAPDTRTTQARGRSRILRPPGPLPAEVVPGSSEPVAENAGVFAGWIRAGYMESQAMATDNIRGEGRLVQVRSGLVPRTNTGNQPIPVAPRRFRWHELDDTKDESPSAVTQFYQQMDATAWDALLAPVARLRAHLQLRPAPLASPLDLLDTHGSPAVSLRYWRMRPHDYDYGPQTPMIDGVALFVRGDLLRVLAAQIPGLEVSTVVESRELREPADNP